MITCTIGDVHGRDIWKFITHGSSYEFEEWKNKIIDGVSINDVMFTELSYHKYDKIIYIGDYVDSFDIPSIEIKRNLEDIIFLKQTLGDKVVLLLGNHDIQYFCPEQRCSGYRIEMKDDLYDIFTKHEHLFVFAHEEIDKNNKKYLWTHAGVTSGWYRKVFLKDLTNKNYRFKALVDEFDIKEKTISQILNFSFELRLLCLFNVDTYSGGFSKWASPLWVRPNVLNYSSLRYYNQIVGHTQQDDIMIINHYKGKKFPGYKHYYIDCLETSGSPLILEL